MWPGSGLATVTLLALLAAAGCAHSLGYAGAHPGYMRCKGKGSINATGAIAGAGGVGAAGLNSFTVVADCGDGFELEQGRPRPTLPAAAPAK